MGLMHPKCFALAILTLMLTLACGSGDNPGMYASTGGSLDASFGTNGHVITSINGDDDAIQAMALQSDGKIVVAGYSLNGTYRNFAVARYTSAGILDTTFNGVGTASTAVGTGNAEAFAMAVQSDGKIVLAGYCTVSGSRRIALARFTSTGVLDTTFGTAGIVTQAIGTISMARALVLDSSGRLVVGGYGEPSGVPVFALARFTSAGVLDSTFGSSGVVETAINSTDDEINALALQSDGNILAAGYSTLGSYKAFALARYTTAGVLDTSFGTLGTVVSTASIYDNLATSLALQSDGKIVAAGRAYSGTSYDFALIRYTSAGSVDSAFGSGGKTLVDFGAADGANAVLVRSDGKLMAAGYSGTAFALAQFTSSGALDTSFNTSGKLTTVIGIGGTNVINAITQQSDKRILAAGYYTSSSVTQFALLRFYP